MCNFVLAILLAYTSSLRNRKDYVIDRPHSAYFQSCGFICMRDSIALVQCAYMYMQQNMLCCFNYSLLYGVQAAPESLLGWIICYWYFISWYFHCWCVLRLWSVVILLGWHTALWLVSVMLVFSEAGLAARSGGAARLAHTGGHSPWWPLTRQEYCGPSRPLAYRDEMAWCHTCKATVSIFPTRAKQSGSSCKLCTVVPAVHERNPFR